LFGDVQPENVLLDLPTVTETEIQYPSIRGYKVDGESLTEEQKYGDTNPFYTPTAAAQPPTTASTGYLLFRQEKLIAAFNGAKTQYAEAEEADDETTLLLKWLGERGTSMAEYTPKQDAKDLYYTTLDSEYKKMKEIQGILNNNEYKELFGLVSDQQFPDKKTYNHLFERLHLYYTTPFESKGATNLNHL
jgi:hypothetical protein